MPCPRDENALYGALVPETRGDIGHGTVSLNMVHALVGGGFVERTVLFDVRTDLDIVKIGDRETFGQLTAT